MPSFDDQASSILEFHYALPELQIMDKGTEINNHQVHHSGLLQNLPNFKHLSVNQIMDKGTEINNHQVYHFGLVKNPLNFKNLPANQTYNVAEDGPTVRKFPRLNNYPNYHYSVQDIPQCSGQSFHQAQPEAENTVQKFPNCSNYFDHHYSASECIVQNVPKGNDPYPICKASPVVNNTVENALNCNNYSDHKAYYAAGSAAQDVPRRFFSPLTTVPSPNQSPHVPPYPTQEIDDDDSDIEIIEEIKTKDDDLDVEIIEDIKTKDDDLDVEIIEDIKTKDDDLDVEFIKDVKKDNGLESYAKSQNADSQAVFKFEKYLSQGNLERVKIVKEIKEIDCECIQITQKCNALKLTEKKLMKPRYATNISEQHNQPLYVSLEHKIYLENRAKAKPNSTVAYPPKTFVFPLYNQPKDTDIYHANIERHKLFKPKLVAYLQQKKQDQIKKESIIVESINKSVKTWKEHTHKIESSQIWKEKQTHYYKYFSKQFPEIRQKCINQNSIENKKAEPLTVLPPKKSDEQFFFRINRDPRLIEDPLSEHEQRNQIFLQQWSEKEKDKFVKHFHTKEPTNFTSEFANEFDGKTVQDCVRFYYLTKHKGELKEVIFEKKRKRRKKGKVNLTTK